ncbi:DUF1294 domain-containing protein [Roseospira visakhapatnamensis]|uniref:Uncharacterized membrane protein YsdA (DUF1294 family)/cold shock CspA family protein n=1 Tax=Roseospira visakhapatnamensis TaxID=390880 RepID=A0A7W6W963_9PROT|nr:cold shock and DUF1294 domain-containing protein [Roseospira visakhapatnamensis]MBB4265146.1 uncharacterized membrane protein YsdA (DUF1294 family)/cold shock CspA family protein [Roseospira visakhapatnamensis]
MRTFGTITTWKDPQGFGFITPQGGGESVFVHVNAFNERSRRPAKGDVITFDLTTDGRDRTRAANVEFFSARQTPRVPSGVVRLAMIFVTLFSAVLVFLAITGAVPVMVPLTYAIASVATFAVYARDKEAARVNGWRIKESKLHGLSLLGGWPGALMGQTALRHKIRKPAFVVVFWLTVVMNCLGLAAVAWLSGMLWPTTG